jgi:hypothetical protein
MLAASISVDGLQMTARRWTLLDETGTDDETFFRKYVLSPEQLQGTDDEAENRGR